MTAYELYRQARLTEAIEAALQKVKSAPNDIDARVLLCDLLCFDNQLERADRQLDVAAQQEAGLAAGIGLYRQLIRAAVASLTTIWPPCAIAMIRAAVLTSAPK